MRSQKGLLPNPVKRYGELPTSIILSKWNPVCWEVLPVAHIHILLSTTWPDADQVEEGGSTTNSPGWVINSMTFFMSERVSVRSKNAPTQQSIGILFTQTSKSNSDVCWKTPEPSELNLQYYRLIKSFHMVRPESMI